MAKSWYIVHTYTGYEKKIERTLRALMDEGKIDTNILCDIKVPEEEVVEIKDGKKKIRKNMFLAGYIMLEMDLPDLGWKDVCSQVRRIQGVTGFVGTNPNVRPRPISKEEATNLLQKTGDIKGESKPNVKPNFDIGEQVKIIDGPFATFTGSVEELLEKSKVRVMVQIFGRATPVDVDYAQVERLV